jgi:imidazolonepropionase-like amidohydrolase
MRRSRSVRRALAAGASVFLLGVATAPLVAQVSVGEEGTFVIRGATVVTVSGGNLTNTDVLIRDGKIAQLGPNLQAQGATVVDARGKFVYPGMFDSFTPVGLAEIGGIATMNLRSELGDFNPNDRAIVAINVESEMIPITRSNGVTNVLTAPSGGIISGQAAIINLSGWTWEDMSVKTSAAFIINYPNVGGGGGGRRGGGGGGGRGGGPAASAEQQLRALKDLLREAKAYEAARATGSAMFDLKLESMRPLVRGETLALVSAGNEAQIRGAIELADTFGLKVAVLGADEAWKVADLLARKNVPVVLGSIQSEPAAEMPYDAVYAQPGVLVRAGVKIAFSTGGASNARHVPYHAALAVAYDLPADAALKALTLWPAQIFGVDSQLGSVEVGKMANVFITDGDPLDVRTHVLDVFIEGRRVSIDDRHTQLYEKYRTRKQ